jgi:D-glycero-alpha-D-manno-heptose 1-phosphate guanylyltransferase
MSRTALVLCGGQGSRFRSVSKSPKILAPFRNGLFIDWLFAYLAKNGFEKIILSLGYKSEEILQYVNTKFMHGFCISILERTPLGTGGAITNAFDTVTDDELCIFNGDTFWTMALDQDFLKRPIGLGLCLTKVLPVNDRYGEFNVDAGQLIIKRGSPKKTLSNSKVFIGIARVSRELETDKLVPPYSFEDLLSVQKNKIETFDYAGEMFDFGTPNSFKVFGEKYNV